MRTRHPSGVAARPRPASFQQQDPGLNIPGRTGKTLEITPGKHGAHTGAPSARAENTRSPS